MDCLTTRARPAALPSPDGLGYIHAMTTSTLREKPERQDRTVLVVDDQETIVATVRAALEREGFDVDVCGDGPSALRRVRDEPPALVILDVGLPGMDGLEVLREIRRGADLPVVMLTARDDEFDRVLGLELGADDYVPKPFSPRELVARVKSVLRRSGSAVPPATTAAPPGASFADDVWTSMRIEHGGLVVDLANREVLLRGELVETTRREFDLLAMLASSPRQVFSREQLLRSVWDSSSDWQAPATVTEHVRRLRQKLESDPTRPSMLLTVRGVGYRFVPPRG
jgi:DNA-binding response OmpR family regulator